MKTKHWLLAIWGDVDPELFGPYKSDQHRLRKARQLRRDEDSDIKSGLYRLDCPVRPDIGAFCGGDFPD